jgi:hypothetical protein
MLRLCLAAIALTLSAAVPAQAQENEREAGPMSRLLPHLDSYLEIPAEERSHFRIDYVVGSRNGAAPDEIGLWYFVDDQRTDLALDSRYRITNLPAADIYAENPSVWVNQPPGSMSMNLIFAYDGPVGLSFDQDDLRLGLGQANQAMRQAAGVASLFAPRLDVLVFVFDGPVPEAVAVHEDGRRTALTVQENRATYRPQDRNHRNVVRLEFGEAPVRVLFDS